MYGRLLDVPSSSSELPTVRFRNDDGTNGIAEFEDEIVAHLSDLAAMFALPRSYGQIYGLLFASIRPLSFTDIVGRLDLSKGSVSQRMAPKEGTWLTKGRSPGDAKRYPPTNPPTNGYGRVRFGPKVRPRKTGRSFLSGRVRLGRQEQASRLVAPVVDNCQPALPSRRRGGSQPTGTKDFSSNSHAYDPWSLRALPSPSRGSSASLPGVAG